MLPYIYNGPPPRSGTYGTGGDNYRRCLEKVGIIEKVKRGQYRLLYHIKDEVTASQIKDLAYNQNWKQWFINIKDENHEKKNFNDGL